MADSVTSGVNIGSSATLSHGTRDQSGDGAAIVPAPGAGKYVIVRELYVWLSSLSSSNGLTLKLGSLTLPTIPLGSGAPAFSMFRPDDEHIRCSENGAVYINLSGTDQVAFMCMYDVV